jgi:ubiquinone/menaquinone biosynthesis C-methylase UbiE
MLRKALAQNNSRASAHCAIPEDTNLVFSVRFAHDSNESSVVTTTIGAGIVDPPAGLPGILAAMTTLKQYIKPLGDYSMFSLKQMMNKYWYPLITRRWNDEDVVFLNWGYEEDPPLGLPLPPEDEPNRYGIQLYHRTATQTDLSDKKVLEISCGHGGGGAYLVRTCHPASYTGLDYNPDGVAFARKRYNLPGLDFVHGNAESLPFPDESFDAVVNVEASHAYPHFDRFLPEVTRVLRPGGHFLYADFRGFLEYDAWDAALASMPMQTVSKRVINAEVLRGLDKNSARYQDLVKRHVPIVLRPFGRLFTGLPGTLMYREMQRGRLSYRMYHFTKD